MPIRLYCPNGHELVVDTAHIGKKVRCPACKHVMVVPDPRQQVQAPPMMQQPIQQSMPQPMPQPMGYPQQHPAQQPMPRQQAVPQPRMQHAVQQAGAPPMQAPMPPQMAPPHARQRQPAQQLEELEELPDDAYQDEEEEEPRPRKKKKKNRAGMQRTNLGLAFHYWKMFCYLILACVFLAMEILMRVAMVSMQANAAAGNVSGAVAAGGFIVAVLGVLGILMMVVMVVTPVLGFVGSLLCLWVPPKTGSKPLIMISFGFDCASIGGILIGIIMTFSATAAATGPGMRGAVGAAIGVSVILMILGFLMGFVAWILFMLFMKGLCYYLRDRGTGDEAIRVMIVIICLMVGYPVFAFFLILALHNVPGLLLPILGLSSLAAMIALIKVLFAALALISTLRNRIDSRFG